MADRTGHEQTTNGSVHWIAGMAVSCALLLGGAAARSTEPIPLKAQKDDAIARLRFASNLESKAIDEIERQMKARFGETSSVRLRDGGPNGGKQASKRLDQTMDALDFIVKRRDERVVRRQVLEQLLHSLDLNWKTGTLRDFLSHQLVEMALTESIEPPPHRFWKFYSYLSVALREVPEPGDDPIEFVLGYMNDSSVLDPRPPSAYMADRSYANGSASASARPITPEKAGDETDRRLRELGLLRGGPKSKGRSVPPAAPDVSLRYRPVPPAPPGPPGT